MNDVVRRQQNTDDRPDNVLALPAGDLGVHFSETVPCEISRIDEKSPILDSSLQFLGRLAFQLSIPNKIKVHGAIDNVTLEAILTTYSNIPNRRLMFKNRNECSKQGLVTATLLPKGPIAEATFRSSRKGATSLKRLYPRVYVESAPPNMDYEFPVGHFVKKVIIPNLFELENGISTSEMLKEILDHFAEVKGRMIVFQKEYPIGGTVTNITLPKGPTGMLLSSDIDDSSLPVVSTVLGGSSACQLNVPVDHIIKKLIVPNEITIERMGRTTIERVLNDYSEVDGRIIVLQEFHRDISTAGATVAITLPTGRLGIVFNSYRGAIWVVEVKEDSQLLNKIPRGFYVESLVIPDELELIGKEELREATYFSDKLKESSHISHRILVLQQNKKDVKKRHNGKELKRELV